MSQDRGRQAERLLLFALWAAVALFAVAMVAAGWPRYWRFVAAETTPLAWLESILLVLTAFVAGIIAFVRGFVGGSRRVIWGWIALAAGFAALALDERFALHERIRDRMLKPTGIKLLPWMEAGDWLIPLYMLCGLAAAWGIWRLVHISEVARRFFIAALLLSACAAAMDTIDVRSLSQGMERLLQSVEEGVETAAMTSFLSAFLCTLTGTLRSLLKGAEGGDFIPEQRDRQQDML